MNDSHLLLEPSSVLVCRSSCRHPLVTSLHQYLAHSGLCVIADGTCTLNGIASHDDNVAIVWVVSVRRLKDSDHSCEGLLWDSSCSATSSIAGTAYCFG
jgi:hypothetical protein